MFKLLCVGLGGFAGASGRYLLSSAFVSANQRFPWITLAINLIGSFLIGIVAEFAARTGSSDSGLTLFLKVGLCGGFTTFSSFSLEMLGLLEQGRTAAGVGYALLSVLLCLAGTFAGAALVRTIGK